MTFRRFHAAAILGIVCVFAGVLLAWRRVADAQRRRGAVIATPSPTRARSASTVDPGSAALARVLHAVTIENPVDGLDPSRARREGDRYVVALGDRRAVLTLEPAWQRAVTDLLTAYELPRAAVVLLDSDTGRVRVYASRGEHGSGDLARDPTPPAASVFKVVTASLLLQRGIADDAVTCFSGGFHAIRAQDLVADRRRDHDCISLAEAFGRSANTVFARRALERLTPPELLAGARAWGFGEAIPFDAVVSAGDIDVPDATLDFARTAAGFWHSHLSPVHGAIIAQAVARGGEMQRPFVVDGIYDAHGVQLAMGAPRVWRRAVAPEIAQALGRMMVHSVSEGTAYHAFHDNAGRAFLPGVDVGGKTGTLTGDSPFRAYTWFIGNASNATTRVSFAVMVANGPVWRVRAAQLARQVLQIVYHGRATD